MISAIVLAAGESRRMGCQKLLLPFGRATIISHIVDQVLQSCVDQVVVVVGRHGNRIADELAPRSVTVVTNAEYASGMLSSVRCGLQALPENCQAAMLVLGDQPMITASLLNDLVEAFCASDKGILVPLHGSRRGHPIVFSSRYCTEILSEFDDVGLRGLLHAHPDDTAELIVPTPDVLSDVDYPEEYGLAVRIHQETKRDE